MRTFKNLLSNFLDNEKVFDLVLLWGLLFHAIAVFIALFLCAKNPLDGIFSISFLLVLVFIGLILSGEITNEEI